MLYHADIAGLLSSRDCKEDAVRETVVLPMLRKLGYGEDGRHRLVRSRTLKNPFIRLGTRKIPIRSVPDYTLYGDDKVLCVLDAKRPTIDLDAPENIQQAYSYAIHPDIRTDHFALCNGTRLVVYDTTSSVPIIDLAYADFDREWDRVEKALGPRFLRTPALRRFAPDFGSALTALGIGSDVTVHLGGVKLDQFAMMDKDTYTVGSMTSFQGVDHCVSFDFHPVHLPLIAAGLPPALRELFLNAFEKVPFQVAAELAMEIDVDVTLGGPVLGMYEQFVPLIVRDVTASRFCPERHFPRSTDIPEEVFRLRDHFADAGLRSA